MIGKTHEIVLVEKRGIGRTPCFAPVRFDGHARAGSIVAGRASPAPMATSLIGQRGMRTSAKRRPKRPACSRG